MYRGSVPHNSQPSGHGRYFPVSATLALNGRPTGVLNVVLEAEQLTVAHNCAWKHSFGDRCSVRIIFGVKLNQSKLVITLPHRNKLLIDGCFNGIIFGAPDLTRYYNINNAL